MIKSKICPCCSPKKKLPIERFSFRKDRNQYRKECRKCHHANRMPRYSYFRKWYKRFRHKITSKWLITPQLLEYHLKRIDQVGIEKTIESITPRKICKECNQKKPLEKFWVNSQRGYRYNKCGSCMIKKRKPADKVQQSFYLAFWHQGKRLGYI